MQLKNVFLAQKKFLFLLLYFILFIFREREKEGKREGEKINMWLPPMCPRLGGPVPATQACTLTGNRTGDSLVHKLALNPLSHSSWGLAQKKFLSNAMSVS